MISKTLYIDYLKCAKNAWLKLHKKQELKDFFALSDSEQAIMDKGNLVELWARKLFPAGILIEEHGEDAALLTKSYIEQKKLVLFQSTFFHDTFLVRNDVLEFNETTGKWILYEIKGKNSLEEKADEIDHIEDATFQSIVLKEQGIELESVFIIHLNKDYLRMHEIDIDKLFVINNITEKVKERESRTRERMQKAKIDLLENRQELFCSCIYKGRNAQCKTFAYSYPYVPAISVHDIARISEKKLTRLVNDKVFNIDGIPENFELTDIQRNQVNSYKLKKTFIDPHAIKQELNKLTYPLYFLDYESYAHPIPLFDGFQPYKQIPFQVSLHILKDEDSKLVHVEYLHESMSDPSLNIIQVLLEHIQSEGSVIVWHKAFERMINKELADRHPNYKEFLSDINDRIYDLEDIFLQQMYVHPLFKGKTSIKSILPALVPESTYEELAIQKGDEASVEWIRMLSDSLTISEKQTIANNLREYCKLDTHAMYEIWRFLKLNFYVYYYHQC